jgi:hypothetical protein
MGGRYSAFQVIIDLYPSCRFEVVLSAIWTQSSWFIQLLRNEFFFCKKWIGLTSSY